MFRAIAAAIAGLFVFAATSHAGIVITIDKSAQNMTVDVDGNRLWNWPVSTGRRGYATPQGSYKPFRMEEDHYSKEWDDAPMPHSIFFTKRGHAIHGTYDVRRLGSPASHGCVRLSTENAAMLFALIKQQGVLNTQVVVTGDEQFSKSETKRPKARKIYRYDYRPETWPPPMRHYIPGPPPRYWGPYRY